MQKKSPPPNTIAYTTSDLLQFVGRTKLFEEIASGRLRCRKLGRKNIFLVDDVVAWLQALPNAGSDVDGDVDLHEPEN